MFATDETIAAIASPPGKALRGIMRISGPDTLSVLRDLCGDFPVPDRAARVSVPLDLGSTLGEVDASVLVWPGTMSYTGMPSAEVHLSGAQPILNAALSLALAAGARLAQPGEFTLRAFLAGRLDLTEAEAVLGVIDADDKRSLDAALRQMAGGLGKPLRELRSQLLNLLAHLEAGLDFVEDDIEFITQEDLLDNVNRIAKSVKAIEEQVQSRDGGTGSPTVVLRGEPNAGKSSLINALAGNERSIVSPAAGTTRDWIETTISIGGTDVRLIDTAGVESEGSSSSFSAINTLAQRYGEEVQEESQLVVICIDLGQKELTQWQRDAMSCLNDNTIVVGTKSDNEVWLNDEDTSHWLRTSSSTGQGIHELRDAIVHKIQSDSTIEASAVGATAVRCQETLGEASESLGRSVQAIHDSLGEEIVAAELRFALTAIGRVTGEVYTDDILDRIFSEFCIGK